MWAASVHTRRWLIVALLAATGTLIFADRAAPPDPTVVCALPARYVQPGQRKVIATLVARPDAVAGCGTLLIETPMEFADITADNATIRVLVPCAEMPRPMYSRTAGTAPVLERGELYRLVLSGPIDGAWRAERIDWLPAPRAAIADRLCVDVHPPSCSR